jgi:hypothetical protein
MKQRAHFLWSAGWDRVSTLFTSKRRAISAIIPLALLLGSVVALLPTQSAFAAPPTLKWIDDSTVQVSGDPLKGSYNITTQSNIDPSTGLVFSGEVVVEHKDGCFLTFSVGVPKGNNGATVNYGKALVWPSSAPPAGKANCNSPAENPKFDHNNAFQYDMGFKNGELYTVTNVENRSTAGDPTPPAQVDDPEEQQIIIVKLNPGWSTVYNTPNPSQPPKESELVPKEDLWILCGNANEPTKSWDPYRNAQTGTPNYDQMEKDCLARRSGWVISTARGPMQTEPIRYESRFTGVKYGDYVVCDFITNSCQSVHKEPKKILTVDNWKLPPNPTAQVPGAETDTDGTVEEPELGCDLTFDLTTIFSLKWLVCPVIDTATFAVGKLEDSINDLLTVGVKDIFDDDAQGNAFHKAWNSFRFFALGLIVIAALIMVVSQAAGVEILDAYTVRKILPRLLFAAIFIALSWDILEFLVELSNQAGLGIRTLIYAPFQALNENNQLGGGSTAVLALIGTGGALAFGWVGLLSFAVTGLLAVLVAFAVLVFRKMLILLLVMMAPFAIAAYILPNTNKLWDTWKGGLLSVLIVFPIISAMIAIGRVFAITSLNASGNRIINQLIAIVAYFAPYFLISMAFRLAGGFIATIGGIANDRTRGAFDRLKNFRSNRMSDNMQKMGTGKRFEGSNPVARAFNATTFGATTFAKSRSKLGFMTNGRVRQSAFEQQRTLNAMQYAKTDAAQVAQHNDRLLQAQTYANERSARQNMGRDFGINDPQQVESAIAAARANGGWGRDQQVNAVNRLFSTGTGFETQRQASETIARVAGRNEDLAAAIAGAGNGVTDKVGRSDLKIGFGEYMNLYRDQMQGNQGAPLENDRYSQATLQALRGNDAVSMSRGKPRAVANAMDALAVELRRATAESRQGPRTDQDTGAVILNAAGLNTQQAAREEVGRLTGMIQQYQNAGMYASPVNVQAVDERVVQPNAQLITNVTQRTGQVQNPVVGRDAQGNPVRRRNNAHDPNVSRGYQQQQPRSMYDPNDPNRQP